MKVGLVAGVHGDEPRPVEVAKSLAKHPIKNVTPIIANYRAVHERQRFSTDGVNMSVSYPGDIKSEHYEGQRAAMVISALMRGKFDIIIDLHEAIYGQTEGQHFAGICGSWDSYSKKIITHTPPQLVALAGMLQFKRIVAAPPGINISGVLQHNTVLMDVCKSSPFGLYEVEQWRHELNWLANEFDPEQEVDFRHSDIWSSMQAYAYIGGLTHQERQELGLPGTHPPFQPFETSTVDPNVCASGWDSRYAMAAGELLYKLGTPYICTNSDGEPELSYSDMSWMQSQG